MSNELFVELSDEQQEVVAGGDATLFLGNFAYYDLQAVGGYSGAAAGPGGAGGTSGGYAMDLTTIGASVFYGNAT
jgi:hypothetical protein